MKLLLCLLVSTLVRSWYVLKIWVNFSLKVLIKKVLIKEKECIVSYSPKGGILMYFS